MFDRLVEKKIQEAIAEGEFDNLEGAGGPVNLDAYFAASEELRAGYAVLKNAGVLPEETILLKDIDALKLELKNCTDASELKRLSETLREKILRYDLLIEHGGKMRRSR